MTNKRLLMLVVYPEYHLRRNSLAIEQLTNLLSIYQEINTFLINPSHPRLLAGAFFFFLLYLLEAAGWTSQLTTAVGLSVVGRSLQVSGHERQGGHARSQGHRCRHQSCRLGSD